MKITEHDSVTTLNLDRLTELLIEETDNAADIIEQIPSGAHIFHGSHADESLTHANLQLASKILLGMTLGYVDESPLVMVFEDRDGTYRIIDLLNETQREKAEAFVETFQEQNERDMSNVLRNRLTA